MKPPNITPPPSNTPVDQIGSSTTVPKQQQLHHQAPANATVTASSQQQQQNLQTIPNDTSKSTTVTTPTTSASTVAPTPSNNTLLSMNAATAIVAPQPTIIKPASLSASVTSTATTTTVAPTTSIPIANLNLSQEQQAPLALTTQHQNRAQIQITPTTSNHIQIQQLPAYQQQNMTAQIVSITSSSSAPMTNQSNPQLSQLPQAKIQPTHLQVSTTISASPATLNNAPTSTGPTALVIIPQHSTGTSIASSKVGTISTKTTQIPTTLTTSAAHVALSASTQSSTIQMQAPVTTIVPTIAQVPVTAHQNTNLVNRPPQTLPVVPMTTASTLNVKNEVNRHTCCLFDNGVRCDRVAGNASFSARIQKIVGTKKMNFALDQSARHSYICDNHKAIITVAKKSTARDTKANAKNFTANNNANTPLVSQHTNNFNDLTVGQPQLQHQMNLEIISSQSRLPNNHATVLNSVPMRPGAQIAYYSDPHTNQIVSMDTMNMKYANPGGDSVPSSSGGVDVDLQQLQVNTLRRYKRHFRVQTRPGLNKLQLAESLKHHFRTLPIIEKEAITYFVYIVKCHRNKLDHDKAKPE